jgi:chorismate mutase
MPQNSGVISLVEDRRRIDDLDRALIDTLRQRMLVSQRIQNSRVSAGGTRIDEDRETAILGRYRDAFGDSGPALADAVLRICRG